MADPTKYLPSYSYSGWQATNPSKPLPAPQVDNDFANISTSVNQTIDALKQIRRSDGSLQNGVVTVDSLSPGISPGFVLRGQWADGAVYMAADSVILGDGFYRANVAHTASAANRPDVDAVTWQYLFSVGDLAGAMSIVTYDPTGITADVFDRANHYGTNTPSDGTVTGPKLADNAVGAPKLADGAVSSSKILAGAVGATKLADGAVESAKIAAKAVTAAKLGDDVVSGQSTKALLVDADVVLAGDSADSGKPKKSTLANLIASIFTTGRKIANANFDTSVRLWDTTDNSKGLSFDLTGIATGQTRKITMPDRDVNLGDVGLGIGVGQTWQDVSASRAVLTSYQNTTGRTIAVSCTITEPTSNNSGFEVSSNGSTWVTLFDNSPPVTQGALYFCLVPAGWYYRVSRVSGTGALTVTTWAELR